MTLFVVEKQNCASQKRQEIARRYTEYLEIFKSIHLEAKSSSGDKVTAQ